MLNHSSSRKAESTGNDMQAGLISELYANPFGFKNRLANAHYFLEMGTHLRFDGCLIVC